MAKLKNGEWKLIDEVKAKDFELDKVYLCAIGTVTSLDDGSLIYKPSYKLLRYGYLTEDAKNIILPTLIRKEYFEEECKKPCWKYYDSVKQGMPYFLYNGYCKKLLAIMPLELPNLGEDVAELVYNE